MRRIAHINPKLQLTRIRADRSEERLSRHAFIRAGDRIRARSGEISYGNIGYTIEFLGRDLQSVIGDPLEINLDIAKRSSIERTDVFYEDRFQTVSKRARHDYERHRDQVDVERRRGVFIEWKGKQLDCLVGSRGESRNYEEGGYDRILDLSILANRRQFFDGESVVIPQPFDRMIFEGDGYYVQSVRRDISVVNVDLTRDKKSEVNK